MTKQDGLDTFWREDPAVTAGDAFEAEYLGISSADIPNNKTKKSKGRGNDIGAGQKKNDESIEGLGNYTLIFLFLTVADSYF